MFIGHFAVGFAAKQAAPKTSLGTLFLAAQFLDLLWPVLLIAGIEHVRIDPGNTPVTPLDFYDYPISHSLAAVVGWAALFGLVYYGLRRSLRGSLIVALCVASHWLLDALTHRPDLPLFPGGRILVGLGLWRSVALTVAVEAAMFVLGAWFYIRVTIPRDRLGTYLLAALLGFLGIVYAGSIFGPPPPSVGALQWVSLAGWLFVPWGYWIDRHRKAVPVMLNADSIA